jgi:hypothetical protein
MSSDLQWYIDFVQNVVQEQLDKKDCNNLKATEIIDALKEAYFATLGLLKRKGAQLTFLASASTILKVQTIIDHNILSKACSNDDKVLSLTHNILDVLFNNSGADRLKDTKSAWKEYKATNNIHIIPINTNVVGGRKTRKRSKSRKSRKSRKHKKRRT